MEIRWYGYACCALADDAITIIADPFASTTGLTLPTLTADLVTSSQNSVYYSARDLITGPFKYIDRPGEYEIGGIFITANAFYPQRSDSGQARCIVFVYEINGLTVCHLGGMGYVPSQSQIEALGSVDILLAPVGGGPCLNAAAAAEVIGLIQPTISIPIFYDLPGVTVDLAPLDRFLKEMGQSQIAAQSKLQVESGNLPGDSQIIVLRVDG